MCWEPAVAPLPPCCTELLDTEALSWGMHAAALAAAPVNLGAFKQQEEHPQLAWQNMGTDKDRSTALS